MMTKKVMTLELSRENEFSDGYLYRSLELPAQEYEIRDVLQQLRQRSADITPDQIAIYNSKYIPQLEDKRFDSPTVDELNFFAKRLAEMDETDMAIMQALCTRYIKDDDEFVSIKDLINMTYGLDSVSVLSNVTNDEQLADFVIENEMQDDVASIPESARYLLDKARIAKFQREMDGGVYSGNLYVCTEHFEMPKVYDGHTLPETTHEPWFAFRLQVAQAPQTDEPFAEPCEWISLPMTDEAMTEVAKRHNASSLKELVYYDFQSSVAQITTDDFTQMLDIEKLNALAFTMAEMSPDEQITFKAALEAERKHGINLDDILNISNNLHRYEMNTCCEGASDFFKQYLLTHMDTKFDERWLDPLVYRREGSRLLEKLGATVTDYGIISSAGGSLYKLVSYDSDETVTEDVAPDEDEDMGEDEGMVMSL